MGYLAYESLVPGIEIRGRHIRRLRTCKPQRTRDHPWRKDEPRKHCCSLVAQIWGQGRHSNRSRLQESCRCARMWVHGGDRSLSVALTFHGHWYQWQNTLGFWTYATTAASANLVNGDHPVLNTVSVIRFQALSARPATEKGCFDAVSSNCFDIWRDVEENDYCVDILSRFNVYAKSDFFSAHTPVSMC